MDAMIANTITCSLTPEEIQFTRQRLGREPNELEWALIDAEWSEHCSYKSSRAVISQLPTGGDHVLVGPGYDSGVIEIGDGLILTAHIESHNHPSAVDPYGGAATGIGGVVRDILCMGTRPIALLDSLKFGDITESDHSKWLLKNVVRGIADYGNCIGVPTVAGEIEFDDCYERNCLVDVVCVGLGRKDELLLAQATTPGDSIFLVGGSTGRDGIHGATFASRVLAADSDRDRSAVQIPDPFTKKMIIEATLEANRAGVMRGCKDLGGGGLATGLSEIADKGESGVDVHLEMIPLREPGMSAVEIMISESQERMLLIAKNGSESKLEAIMAKYEVSSARIGEVTSTQMLTIFRGGKPIAQLPTDFLANAPIIQREARQPKLIAPTGKIIHHENLQQILIGLLSSPTIASKEWVYSQFDHEVGIRTVVKPGQGDAAVLRLPNGKFVAIKSDGNSRICELDPYIGAASILAESCRNITAVGAKPIALLDHCQFGNPNDEEVFWSFSRAVKGIADLARVLHLPCVGGKVSFYNEDEEKHHAIKSSPVITVIGIVEKPDHVTTMNLKHDNEIIIAVGKTKPEVNGSEYYNHIGSWGGSPPTLDFQLEGQTQNAVLECIKHGYVTACHDCARGGLAVTLSEMAIRGKRGATVDLTTSPMEPLTDDELLYSESNSRFILTTSKRDDVLETFQNFNVPAAAIGVVGGESLNITLQHDKLECALSKLQTVYTKSLEMILEPWRK
jgi:phosphoribosylformylglycinamidine synthase subunit PurL